jgi:plasmid stabilization system protein ParE
MKIVWSDIAEADLGDIYDYIARDVPYYAEQFTDRLIDAVGILAEQPRLGRRVPEAHERDDVRELIFHSYRVIYLIKPDRIDIVSVIHGSRDLNRKADKPWEVG